MTASDPGMRGSDVRLANLLSQFPTPGQRTVMTICSQTLIDRLEPHSAVIPLWAGAVRNFLARSRPDFVIIQESFLERGLWVDSWDHAAASHGEMSSIAGASRDAATTVISIRDGSGRMACLLDELANEHFPNRYFFKRTEGGARRSRVFEIVQAFAAEVTTKQSTRQ